MTLQFKKEPFLNMKGFIKLNDDLRNSNITIHPPYIVKNKRYYSYFLSTNNTVLKTKFKSFRFYILFRLSLYKDIKRHMRENNILIELNGRISNTNASQLLKTK